MKRIVYFITILLSIEISAQTNDCNNLFDIELVKTVLKTHQNYLLNDMDQRTFRQIYPSFVSCPSNYLNSSLSNKEKNNLKKILQRYELDQQASYIVDNLEHIDLDSEINNYIRIHKAIYGNETELNKDMQQIIQKRDLFLQDKKNLCKDSVVDTSSMGPVRDQEDVGWCYAFSTADLLSFYTKKRLSAVDIAILNNNFATTKIVKRYEASRFIQNMSINDDYYKNKDAFILSNHDGADQGGQTSEAINIGLQRGLCLEKDLPTVNSPEISLDLIINAPAYYKKYNEIGETSCIDRIGRSKLLFPNLQRQQIIDIIQKTNQTKLLLELRNANCKEQINLKNKKFVKNINNSLQSMFRLLNRKLDQNEPAIVNYDMNLVQNGEGAHSSLVVGRRFNSKTNRCEYKVRNSWGVAPLNRLNIKNEDGYYWVDEASLKKHLFEVNALD